MTSPRTDSVDDAALDDALSRARIPALLGVLVQLTGDERWLTDRYRPARSRGYETPRDGRLDPVVQGEVRAAAAAALRAYYAGTAPVISAPDDALVHRIMNTLVGEDVPDDVAPLVAEQSGFARHPVPDVRAAVAARTSGFSVAVIGAGVSGLLALDRLRAAGVPCTVFEKNDGVGGTWWENSYPGVRVDIPSDFYSVSYAPHNWPENFTRQPELKEYLGAFARDRDLLADVRLSTEVAGMRWDEDAAEWVLTIIDEAGTREHRANAVISAVGIHNRPQIPAFPGRELFRGPVVHSAQWQDDLDLTGKRVAVLGSGATSMQLVCAIADDVAELTVLQRTPQWVLPHSEYFGRPEEADAWLCDNVPFYRHWWRAQLYWLYTDRLYPLQVVDADWDRSTGSVSGTNQAFRSLLLGYLHAQLADRPDLIPLVTPDYPVMGKRLLIDNGWFRTLQQPHVELVRAGIAEFTTDGIITTDGRRVDVDVVVLCTGFEQQRMLAPMTVVGRATDQWDPEDARAYLGVTTPGFPNMFAMFGPNANPPGGSYFTIGEAQAHYIVDLITDLVAQDLAWIEVRPEVCEQYNVELDAANARMAYGVEGVKNYYRNAAGRVVTNSPWRVPEYWRRLHDGDRAAFVVGEADAS